MSFWRNFGFQPISHIESILDRDSFTVEDLFDEDELLQECKSQNQRLIDFLVKPESLNALFEFITKEAPEDADRKRKENYPFLASEILCMDIQPIIEAVYKDERYLEQLYENLEKSTFNLGLAAYTSKVAINFLGRKTIETMSYIKKQEKIIEKFIKHLDKSPIVDILLKIISIEEYQGCAGTLEWLDTSDLIGGIISKFDPALDSEFHENASFILSEIVELTRNFTDSPLLSKLESEEMIKKLYSYIFAEDSLGTNFLHGLTVIIRLFRRHKDSNETVQVPLEELHVLFRETLNHIEDLSKMLKVPTTTDPKSGYISSTVPLGFHRLKVVEFFADLINSRYLCIDKKIIELDILSKCLDLFFIYQWNNLLHSQIHQICQIVLYSENDDLKVSLLTDSKLLDRIIEANDLNTREMKQPKGIRFGYMGFLNSIAHSICEVAKNTPVLKQIVDNNQKWSQFVIDSLLPVLNIENEPLGEFRPSLMMPPESAGEEDDDDQNYDAENDTFDETYDTGDYIHNDDVYETNDDDMIQDLRSGGFQDSNSTNVNHSKQNSFIEEDEDEDDDLTTPTLITTNINSMNIDQQPPQSQQQETKEDEETNTTTTNNTTTTEEPTLEKQPESVQTPSSDSNPSTTTTTEESSKD
eukprot:gene9691-11898_t